jgi:hypothetical protein
MSGISCAHRTFTLRTPRTLHRTIIIITAKDLRYTVRNLDLEARQ